MASADDARRRVERRALSLDAWQLLVDSSNDAYISIDGDGLVTGWNTRAHELFGWDRAEAVGRLLADLIVPPEHQQAHLLGIERFVETGHGSAVFRRLQLPALHRSGQRLEVEFTILPVNDPVSGWQFHSFLRDVTAERTEQRYVRLLQRVAVAANEATSVETAVRATVDAVQDLTESRLAHVYLVDHDGDHPTIVATGWWFPARDHPLADATASMPLAVGQGLAGRVVATREPAWVADIERDENFPRASGALASGVGAAYAFPVMTQDRPVAVIELFLDQPSEPDDHLLDVMGSVGTQLGRVFERQHGTDQLRRLASDREAILSIVGHELRGPLAAAHAAAGILQHDPSDDDRPILTVLDRQLRLLRRLVDMFLTAQRLEGAALNPRPALVSLRQATTDVVADGQFIDVQVDVADDIRVFADADHVAQILWNLLGNAARHGAPPVVVRADQQADVVRLTVSDAGRGVPDDLRPQLFQRFARAPDSPGTGLGLAIVRGLARANGGDATYHYDPAAGSSFTVSLPAG